MEIQCSTDRNRSSKLLGCLIFLLLAAPSPAVAKKAAADPALSPVQYKQLEHARSMAKHAGPKANQLIITVLNSAQTLDECLAIAAYTDAAGFPLIEARTKSLQKGIVLSKTPDDYMRVVLKARQLQCFDVTSQAIKALLASANTPEQLNEVARKSQEIALNDVAHLALEKLFAHAKTVPDAISVAKTARTLGMDDLTRKILKELEDDCRTTAELMALLPQVEPFAYGDVNRYCLHRALDYANSADDFYAIYKQSQRLRQQDIFDVAAFRGKKMILMQKLQEEQAAAADASASAQQELQQAEQKAREDLNKSAPNSGPGF